MKFGEMQIDVSCNPDKKTGFFEKRKEIKEGKRLLQNHPEYEMLKEDTSIKNGNDFYRSVLYMYMTDCILKNNPSLNGEYKKIYTNAVETEKMINSDNIPYFYINLEFLIAYQDPDYFSRKRKEHREFEAQAQLQNKIQTQQDLASGKCVICPYCKSTNTEKISTVSRAVSVSLVGAASGKLGKQWHCKNCGSNF